MGIDRQRFLGWLRENSFGAGLLKVMSGSVAAQGLIILAAPVLTRIYSPTDFGVLGVFLSFCAVASIIATLRYEMAIIVAPDKNDAKSLFVLSILFSVVLSGLIALLLWLFPGVIELAEIGRSMAPLLWILPITILIRGGALAVNMLATKYEYFGRIGAAYAAGRLVDIVIKVALGLAFQAGALGLVIGFILGELVSGVFLWIVFRKEAIGSRIDFSRFSVLFKRYSDFPKYNLPAALLQSLGANVPLIFIAFCFGPVYAGFFELARRVLGRPLSIVGKRFYQVFYQKSFLELQEEGDVSALVERLLRVLILFSFPLFFVIGVFGESLFALVFGVKWAEAGLYAQILAPAWFLRSIATPIRVFNTFQKQKTQFFWHLIFFVLSGAAVLVGMAIGSATNAIVCLSIGISVAYCIHLGITLYLSGASLRRVLSSDICFSSTRKTETGTGLV